MLRTLRVTRELQLPERITSFPKEYREDNLGQFFEACYDSERVLFSTFLLTGFREQEVMFLRWSVVNFELRTVRVTSKEGQTSMTCVLGVPKSSLKAFLAQGAYLYEFQELPAAGL